MANCSGSALVHVRRVLYYLIEIDFKIKLTNTFTYTHTLSRWHLYTYTLAHMCLCPQVPRIVETNRKQKTSFRKQFLMPKERQFRIFHKKLFTCIGVSVVVVVVVRKTNLCSPISHLQVRLCDKEQCRLHCKTKSYLIEEAYFL